MYLNTVDFGSNAFGIRTAAKTYFNTTPMQLKTEESAVLVGMLKATTTYNPRLNPKNSKSRRNVVLSNLLRKKFLTHEEYDSLSELPIELKYTPVKPTDGKAPYSATCLPMSCRMDGVRTMTRISMATDCASTRPSTRVCRSMPRRL